MKALIESWEQLVAAVSAGWTRAEPGALAAVTGVAIPTLNGVWITGKDVRPAVAARLLNEVAASGLPYCLQVRPGGAEQLAGEDQVYERLGFRTTESWQCWISTTPPT